MNKVRLFFSALILFCFVGCGQPQQSAAPTTTTSPAPNASVQVALPQASASVGANVSAPAASASVPPKIKTPMTNPAMARGKDGKPPQMPPGIDRMYRALTLEEINALPPETRDMILKAQGRYPGSPTPTPKK